MTPLPTQNNRAVILRSAVRDQGSQPLRFATQTHIPAIPLVAPCLKAGILGFPHNKLSVIPNAVRAMRTAAPFRALRGKNPSSPSNSPTGGTNTPTCALGFRSAGFMPALGVSAPGVSAYGRRTAAPHLHNPIASCLPRLRHTPPLRVGPCSGRTLDRPAFPKKTKTNPVPSAVRAAKTPSSTSNPPTSATGTLACAPGFRSAGFMPALGVLTVGSPHRCAPCPHDPCVLPPLGFSTKQKNLSSRAQPGTCFSLPYAVPHTEPRSVDLGFLFSLGRRSFTSDKTTNHSGLQPLRNPLLYNSTSAPSRGTNTPTCLLGSLLSEKTPNSQLPTPNSLLPNSTRVAQ